MTFTLDITRRFSMETNQQAQANPFFRRNFIGGPDARIIMGDDEARLLRLWREKRGEVEPEDLSQDLIVQLGGITEELNRTWYERNTGNAVDDVQRKLRHPIRKWMRATLDGRVRQTGAVFEAKFMLPWNFSEDGGAVDHYRRRQVGGNDHSGRPALPASVADGRKEVLALRRKWRAASPLRDRVAKAKATGGQNCRHEQLQHLGRVCKSLPDDPRRCT